MRRQGMSRNRSKKVFSRSGAKHHVKNFITPMRGGIRA